MKTAKSKVPFNYRTIRVTQSRIDKGLLAIPVSLIDYFPQKRGKIYVAFGDEEEGNEKNFTPYTSSSRECRIGGMRDFYEKFQIKDNEELVIQMIDECKYRIFKESQFQISIAQAEKRLDRANDERDADLMIRRLSSITNFDFNTVMYSEFFRLSQKGIETRKYKKPTTISTKENVPAAIRKILAEIYKGKCQISNFGFLMKNGKPHFELHHIKADLGHHLKNLLVVSPNVHAQFTYARVEEYFDEQGWLRRVKFNGRAYPVRHIIDDLPQGFEKETHYT